MIAIIEITKKCNLKCRHCGIGVRGEDLSLPILLQGLTSLEDYFDDFRFVGGEPLMTPDRLEEAIAMVANWDKPISITTNGLLVKGLKKQIKKWNLYSVCLSMDGSEVSHDVQRGRAGAFESVKEAGYILAELGIRIQVSFCLTKLNYHDVEAVYKFCEQVDAEFLRIQPMVPMQEKNREILLLPHELKAVLEDYSKIRGEVDIIIPQGLCLLPHTKHCVAGEMWIYVCSDGVVMPCIYAPLPIGHIGDDPVNMLIERAQFKKPAHGCRSCDYYLSCRGGCRGGSLMYFNDINAPDPNCWIAQEKGYCQQFLAEKALQVNRI